MKKLIFIALIAACGIIQLMFPQYLRVFGIKPDLILACVVVANLTFEFRWAFALSLLAGIFKDSLIISSFGSNTVLFAIWSLLVCEIKRRFSLDYILVQVILLWVIALLQNLSTAIIVISSGNIVPAGIFLRIVFLGALYTAIALPLLLPLTRRWIE
ncbi:MAG: hypothetical protein WC628_07295 [Candidatus Omnitrophota bacterium]